MLPRSHRDPLRPRSPNASGEGPDVAPEAEPGDLVLFDNHLQHASSATRSPDRLRWCFNFRYFPTGWNQRIVEHRDWLDLEAPGALERLALEPRAILERLWRGVVS